MKEAHEKAEFQQEWNQLCSRSECFKVHRAAALEAQVGWKTLTKAILSDERRKLRPSGGVLYLSVASLGRPVPTAFTADTLKQ